MEPGTEPCPCGAELTRLNRLAGALAELETRVVAVVAERDQLLREKATLLNRINRLENPPKGVRGFLGHEVIGRGAKQPWLSIRDFDRDGYWSIATRFWWGRALSSFVVWPWFRFLVWLGVWKVEEGCRLVSGSWQWPPGRSGWQYRFRHVFHSIPAFFRSVRWV